MKTLKTFFITLLFTASIFYSNANEYNETNLDINSISNLTFSIKNLIRTDYIKVNNYLNQHEIVKLKEEVVVTFYINNDNYFNIVNIESKDQLAKDYLIQLLNGKKMNTNDSTKNKI